MPPSFPVIKSVSKRTGKALKESKEALIACDGDEEKAVIMLGGDAAAEVPASAPTSSEAPAATAEKSEWRLRSAASA